MDNSLLLKEIYSLLTDNRININERIKLREKFTHSYYEIIKLCFDISIDESKLKYYIENNDINNKYTNAKFISKTIDNPKSYDILNYFCYNFIKIIKERSTK